MTEEQELSERLEASEYRGRNPNSIEAAQPTPPSAMVRTDIDYSLWQVLPNGCFRPGSRTQKALPPGAYRLDNDDRGLYLRYINVISDTIIELPEKSHIRVLEGIRKFWSSKDKYKQYGLIYKRGVLLWGPPGGGKTVTTQLLMKEIIAEHKGIVLFCEFPPLCVAALQSLRAIEPKRPLICLLEDVDEIINHHGEHTLLALLDGEHQVDNVVYVATTNYPERLGARIVNRPSRFDERIKIGMPSPESRMSYLAHVTKGHDLPLTQWVDDTNGLSIAHLRELVVAVMCLEQEYETVIERLRHMEVMPKPEEGFRKNQFGLDKYNAGAQAKTAR